MNQEPDGPATTRRDMLLAAAGGMVLAEALAAADNPPGAAVADRGSAIRISKLRAIPVGPKVFVKIETNQKVTGWGEITGLQPQVGAALAESLFELLDGENPTRIEHLWQKLYRSHRDMRGGSFMTHTISAIDMALWDISGKLHGVPVYRLLGGPCRDKIRAYPHARAMKVGTGGPHPLSGGWNGVEPLVKMVESARKQVGKDGLVMFDAHCALPPPMLLQFADAIHPYDVLWIEEPAVPGNIEVFKRLKQHIKVPIATGERDRTIWEVAGYLHNNCIDILQCDCGHTGGISQLKKIAALAEAYHVPMAPHSIMTALGLSASMHVAASIPLFLIQEMNTNLQPPRGVLTVQWEVDKEGYASLPQGPGLGVEVDEARLEDLGKKLKAPPWPVPKYADGSVRDY